MTILQVCAFGAPKAGNFISSLLRLQRDLEALGHETIYVFVERAKDQDWCRELAKTNQIYYLPERMARMNPKVYQAFARIYRENDIDLVHSHFELFDIPATIMAPKKVRVYWHLHDALREIYERGPLSRKLLNRLQYGVFGKRAKLLSVSGEHGSFVAGLGFPKKQIYYLPNGIDCQRIDPESRSIRENFLMFGWEVKRKGVDTAMEAMKKLAGEKSPVRLQVVGQKSCQEFVEAFALGNVFFTDPVADINELYGLAKGFLHISRAEGQSYALLEVIYAGIPVICSEIPENLFAKEFRNVFFVLAGDSLAVADAMKKVADLIPTEADKAYNRKMIEEKYSLDSWCKAVKAFYFEENRGMEKWKMRF